jgi:hypothetical protein
LIKEFRSSDANLLEKMLHYAFKANRLNGEWFSFNENEVHKCIQHCHKVADEIDLKNLVEKVKLQEKQIQALTEQLKTKSNDVNSTDVNNIDKQQNNINNNFKIATFNREDIGFIEDNICKKIFEKTSFGIAKLIKLNRPKEVEDDNISIQNLIKGKVIAHDGTNWNLYNRSEFLENLNDSNCAYVDGKFKELKEKGCLDNEGVKTLKIFLKDLINNFDENY